jgi:hypothetical protein
MPGETDDVVGVDRGWYPIDRVAEDDAELTVAERAERGGGREGQVDLEQVVE